jgi:hypothetical protein
VLPDCIARPSDLHFPEQQSKLNANLDATASGLAEDGAGEEEAAPQPKTRRKRKKDALSEHEASLWEEQLQIAS